MRSTATQQTKIASGKLLTIDNQIDTTTGTVKLRAIFDNKDDALFPNQFVNTRLLVKTLEGVTLIPTSAIQHNGQTAFVYVIQNNTAQMRNDQAGRDRWRQRPRSKGSIRATWWPTAALRSCRTIAKVVSYQAAACGQRRQAGAAPRESVASIHSAAGRDFAADGRDPAGGHRRLHPVAGFRAAARWTIRRSRC